jgi:hypothetical protein
VQQDFLVDGDVVERIVELRHAGREPVERRISWPMFDTDSHDHRLVARCESDAGKLTVTDITPPEPLPVPYARSSERLRSSAARFIEPRQHRAEFVAIDALP